MIKRANINWNAKQLSKMAQKGNISFDNAVQRGYVWDVKRKSLLIHSMISGYPIPPFYAAKNENGYDMLDGKQRINAIVGFLNGDYELTEVPEVEVENEDGTIDMVDINTLHFDELEEALRDEITSYSLTVYYFDGITDDEIAEMFFRLNNGKPLTAIELTRVQAKSMEILTRTHLISIMPMIWKSLQDGLSDKQVMECLAIFFNGKRSASISDTYNQNAGSGSAKKDAVKKRLDEVEKYYNEFFKLD